jgi:hypothetical protein
MVGIVGSEDVMLHRPTERIRGMGSHTLEKTGKGNRKTARMWRVKGVNDMVAESW